MPVRGSTLPASFVVAAVVSLLAAGCGGGGAAGVANVGSSTTTLPAQTGLLAYSECMRSHGVPSFPDPDSTGGIPKDKVIAAGTGPQAIAADKACQHLMPSTGLAPPTTAQQASTRAADGLSFARCMRSHRVSHFPDPTAQGRLSVAMVQAQGIDLHSPAVLRVVEKCLPASHGLLTPAKVNEVLHGSRG